MTIISILLSAKTSDKHSSSQASISCRNTNFIGYSIAMKIIV